MELIRCEENKNGIVLLTINRPEKKNALHVELLEQMAQRIRHSEGHPHNRVLILRGEGSSFCSGMDLAEAKDTEKSAASAQAIANLFGTLYYSRLITIAAVHGEVYAGGVGIAAACDLVVADQDATFWFPETRRGLVPAQVAALLARQISFRHLKELLLFGIKFSAPRAYEIGLVNCLTHGPDLLSRALKYAQEVLEGAPEAVCTTKQWIEDLHPLRFSQTIEEAVQCHQQARVSKEAREGIEAFFEKRTPSWITRGTEE